MKLHYANLLAILLVCLPLFPVCVVVLTVPGWLGGRKTTKTHHDNNSPSSTATTTTTVKTTLRRRRYLNDENPSSPSQQQQQTFEAVGLLDLDFNPAFVTFDQFDNGPGLTVSSFHNVALNPATGAFFGGAAGGEGGSGNPNTNGDGTTGNSSLPSSSPPGPPPRPFIPFEKDLVAVITNLDSEHEPVTVDYLTEEEEEESTTKTTELTDMVWPNQARRAPDGMFPFEAVVVPMGWFAKETPGRLVAFGLKGDSDDEQQQEVVIIHQSTQEEPRFYHTVKFVDLDLDGMLDIVTVRSGYHVGVGGAAKGSFHPPIGELVWFRNPGTDEMTTTTTTTTQISKSSSSNLGVPDNQWEEFVIVEDLGPDVFLDVKDMDGDGIPEIVATHFFAGLSDFDGTPWDSTSQVTLYGAPKGQPWTVVNTTSSFQPRRADLVSDQGMMFSVEIVDLDGDGRLDILATNHQRENDPIDGRVLALEPPTSGLLFEDEWTVHILKDEIWPTKAPPGQPSFRMAPGVAKTFRSPPNHHCHDDADSKPWIVVSGDEASKAWILKPSASEPWVYEEELLFDINQYYGENATHTMLQNPFGITISTIGEIGIREEDSQVTLYVPVFEATDIHIFRSKETTDDHDRTDDKASSSGSDSDEASGAFGLSLSSVHLACQLSLLAVLSFL